MHKNLPRWFNFGLAGVLVSILLGVVVLGIHLTWSSSPTPFNGYKSEAVPFPANLFVIILDILFYPAGVFKDLFLTQQSMSAIVLNAVAHGINAFAIGTVLSLIFKKKKDQDQII